MSRKPVLEGSRPIQEGRQIERFGNKTSREMIRYCGRSTTAVTEPGL